MNLLIKIIILIEFVSSFCFLHAQTNGGSLNIQTNVDSAGLFIDDKFIGIGNDFQVEIESGSHVLHLAESIRIWNAEVIKDTINITSSGSLNREYNFKSQVLINSIPENARVFETDSLVGFTPVLLEAGFSELKLEKPNYSSLLVTSEEISAGNIPELKFVGEQPSQQFYGSTLFYALLGSAIAFGATTAYNKLKADDLYDEYRITGDQGLIDNIEHYDNQSAWTLVAMELCIGAMIYFFLTN